VLEKIKNYFADFNRKSFKKNMKARVSLYKVLISSMEYKDTIKQAVSKRREKLIKRHNKKNIIKRTFTSPGGGEMPFLNHANEELLKGENFSGATRGWVSDNEQMLIESGSSGELIESLTMAQNLLESLQLMKKTVITAMVYPIILLIVLFAMIFGFSFNIIPILIDLLPLDLWEDGQKKLYYFCMFFKDNSTYILAGLAILTVLIIKTISFWTGKIRGYFDVVFPWSIYKEFNAGIFLISFSTLIESGNTPLQALQKLKVQSPEYVKHEIDKILVLINQAINPATAINTGFLGEVGDDIEDIAEHGDFEKILKSYGEEAVEKILESIKSKAGNVKNMLMLAVVLFLVWGYSGFIAISQSVTKAAGL
jgi:type II secretory pathway component PulF